MVRYVSTWLRLRLDRRAVTALEYGLIAGIIVATVMLGFNIMASSESVKFSSVGAYL
jgi:Flp pilus assembly pilin Flp